MSTAAPPEKQERADHDPQQFRRGGFTLVEAFDRDDLLELLRDIERALRESSRVRSLAPFRRTVRDWVVTVRQLSDPTRREVLLGESKDSDFVEVGRPG
jgi:hypothetical protein